MNRNGQSWCWVLPWMVGLLGFFCHANPSVAQFQSSPEEILPGSPYGNLLSPSGPSLSAPSDQGQLSPSDDIPEAVQVWTPQDVFAPVWYEPAYWFGPEPWDRSIEVGINGSA